MLDQARGSEGVNSGEVVCPDGRTFAALITPIEGGGLVAVLHDVTSFKQVERVKNEFIAAVSHDLKNPIMAVSGYSDLLSHAGQLSEVQVGFIKHIQNSAKAMNDLVQNMLQLAQADLNFMQRFESVEMNLLLAEIVDEFAGQLLVREQSLNFDPAPDPVYVNGDALQLRQLFRNLVSNAIKYTPRGGKMQVSARVEGGSVLIQVQDDGYGIPSTDLPFIFDRFYRVRRDGDEAEGNGLGLAIVKSIVEQHDGQISVESEVDKGTCFSVSLPVLS